MFSCSSGKPGQPGSSGPAEFFTAAEPYDQDEGTLSSSTAGYGEDGFNMNAIDFWDNPEDRKEAGPDAPLRTDSDISSITVNYFDPDDFDMSGFISPEDDSPLEIIDYGPEGELPNEMSKRPTIFCVFSKAIVPLSKLGDPLKESPYMKIEPAVSGTFRWYGSKMLSFEPDEKVMPQREYKVKISGVKSLGGTSLENDLEFSFFTEYLKFETVFPDVPGSDIYINKNDIPIEYARKFTVQLTYPFDIDLIKNYIDVKANGKNYKYKISRFEGLKENENLYNRTCILDFEEDFPENAAVYVYLRKGAKSYSDSLGRPDDSYMTLHTIIPFSYQRYSTYNYSYARSENPDSNPVYLYFSHPLPDDPAVIAKYISTSFDIDDLTDYIEVFGTYLRLNNLPVKYESDYKITVSSGLQDIYGRRLGVQKIVSVHVGPAMTYAYFKNSGFRMLESQFAPKIILEYQNIKNAAFNIDPLDNPLSHKFGSYQNFDLEGGMDNIKHFQAVDFGDYLNSSGFGSVAFRFNFYTEKDLSNNIRYPYSNSNLLALQVTDLGVTVRFAYNKAVAIVRSLSTGLPVEGAKVELLDSGNSTGRTAYSDSNGFAAITLDNFNFREDRTEYASQYSGYNIYGFIVRVSKGEDQIYYQPGSSHNRYQGTLYGASNPWDVTNNRYSVMLFTDRGLYKPGEEIVFRGVSQFRSTGDYQPSSGEYKITVDSRYYYSTSSGGEVIYQTTGKLSESGGFYHRFTLPDTIAPDYYTIHFYKSKTEYANQSFQVAEFKRAEFQVSVPAADSVFYAGDKISLSGKADYLSGGAMAGAEAKYFWSSRSASFSPSEQKYKNYVYSNSVYSGRRSLSSREGVLDNEGRINMEQETGSNHAAGVPYTYQVELYVQDISRQELTGSRSVVVHPAEYYIGAKIASNEVKGWWNRYVKQGKKIDFEFIKITPEEQEYNFTSEVKVELIRREWKSSTQTGVYGRMNYNWEQVEILEDTFDLDFKFKGSLSLTPENSGSYLLRISSEDRQGRQVLTELDFYVTGASWVNWRLSSPEKIEMIPDRDEYSPGDTAQIFIKSPLPDGEYLMTIEREGIYEEKIIKLEGSASLIEVPITEDYIPVIYVALCSSSERKETPESYYDEDMGKPRGYFGITAMRITTELKELDVEILPDKDLYKPADNSTIRIKVTRNGKPVSNAEVTFLAVDRGVLDLINYHVPDPVSFFYSPYRFPHAVYGGDSRSRLIDPITYALKDLVGGDSGKDELSKREDFRPLAVFEPFLKTDSDGIAEVRFKFPDTLTTYRSTAFVVYRDKFGFTEQELFVRNPITVRTAMPQAMRLRDTAGIGCILTNLGSEKYKVKVSVRSDILKLDDDAEKTVTLKANETLEIPFKFIAVMEGDASIEFTIRSDVLNEILVQKLEVVYSAIKEAFTVVGHTDKVGEAGAASLADSSVEGFILPSAIDEGYGGITMTLTSNPLPSAANAVFYFDRYPWFTTVWDYLYHALPHMLFGPGVSQIAPGIKYSVSRQRDYAELLPKCKHRDGGYINNLLYKDQYTKSDLWLTMMVAQYEALARLRGRGVMKDEDLNSTLNCLQGEYRSVYVSLVAKARILYILALHGRNTTSELAELLKNEDALGMVGYLYCGLAYDTLGMDREAADILSRVRKFVKVGTRTVDFIDTYESRDYFDSPTHRLAMLDLLYYQQNSIDDMMISYSNTINQSLKYGYWGTPSDTLWVTICAAEIERQESTTDTDLSVEIKLDDIELWKTEFSGIELRNKTAMYRIFDEPLASLKRDKLYPLTYGAEGSGQLFYATTFRYALPAEIISPRDEGICVYREIFDLEGNKVDKNELVLGETYRMKIVISSSKTRFNVGLQVPVPSGCDVLDSSFVTTGSYAESGGTDNREWTREMFYGDESTWVDEGYMGWYEDWWFYSIRPQKRIYKNQVTYRFGMLYRGQQQMDFLFRATTPGIYPTPPAFAEVLDEPEVFGRSAGILVKIK